ncbi:MAG: oxygenase MpaB family protein [Acidimicrobiales bacterium]
MVADQLTPIEGIRRELRRNIRGYLTGSSESRGSVSPARDGWFGPDSMTWLIQSDWSTIIGGVESLFMQTLHPPTMAGVADHSDYEHDPFGRLHRTAQFIGATTFGSADDAQRSVDMVRAIHSRVNGTTPEGTAYEANDPHNLAWVHITEVDGFLRAYRRFGAVDIDDGQADQYVAEMARIGEAMGVERAPRNVSELDSRIDSYRPELRYGAQAREAVRFLLFPPHSWQARGPYAIVLSAAVNLLPAWARRKLWLPPTIPPIDRLVVAPAAKAMVSTIDWIMDNPNVSNIRARSL